jgi:hypothetical protein
MYYLLLFHCNNDFMNTSQHYVICTLPVVSSNDILLQMEDELDMEVELERELAAEQEELLEEEETEAGLQQALDRDKQQQQVKKPLNKVLSLPANFTFSSPRSSVDIQEGKSLSRICSDSCLSYSTR